MADVCSDLAHCQVLRLHLLRMTTGPEGPALEGGTRRSGQLPGLTARSVSEERKEFKDRKMGRNTEWGG